MMRSRIFDDTEQGEIDLFDVKVQYFLIFIAKVLVMYMFMHTPKIKRACC